MRQFQVTIAGLLLIGCQSDSELTDGDFQPRSSFEVIQHNILEPNCVACHQDGTSFARQSDLLLSKDVAYEQLVNRAPKNQGALANGMELVGTKGLESLFESFLWEKINFPDFEHFYSDHSEYGELMPLGGPSLTNGELEYIRRWIIEGAPRDGFVVDDDVLVVDGILQDGDAEILHHVQVQTEVVDLVA